MSGAAAATVAAPSDDLIETVVVFVARLARRALHVGAIGARHVNGLHLTRLIVCHEAELESLALGEAAEARCVDVALVHEDVALLAIDGDETEAFLNAEPFALADHGAVAVHDRGRGARRGAKSPRCRRRDH